MYFCMVFLPFSGFRVVLLATFQPFNRLATYFGRKIPENVYKSLNLPGFLQNTDHPEPSSEKKPPPLLISSSDFGRGICTSIDSSSVGLTRQPGKRATAGPTNPSSVEIIPDNLTFEALIFPIKQNQPFTGGRI
jgi:hypothetical protein